MGRIIKWPTESKGYGLTTCDMCGRKIRKSNKWGICRECQADMRAIGR